ncbi:MAG: hypothetical protein ISS69_12505 [Phycisphaerae bacterium]|nr:hypothetical protein [Phycisphaerae bacterium]
MSASPPPEIPASPPPIPPVQFGGPAALLAPRKPSWPKVVGILGIIFGAFGVIGGAQLIATPNIMDFQKGMMSNMERSFAEHRSSRRDSEMFPDRRDTEASPEGLFTMFNAMWDTPEWFDTWCRVGGTLAVLISGFYIIAAIRLLQIKPGAVGLFYSAAGLAIILVLVKVGVGVYLGSLMSMGVVMNGVIGGIADIVLFIVVASGSKEMFARQAT